MSGRLGDARGGAVLEKPRKRILRHTDLQVYQRSFSTAMAVFTLSKAFPPNERFSFTDQARRASRSVAANIPDAWRKRRYPAAFIAKLNDAEGEAAESQPCCNLP